MSHNPARSVEMWRSPSSCVGLAALGRSRGLGKVLQGSEDVSNDVQGLGLGNLEQSGGGRLVWHVPEP